MKTSLDHLPKRKQEELNQIAEIIKAGCNEVEKIILYGSYARGDYREPKDITGLPKARHVSDYDILVVTSTKPTALNNTLWSQIGDKCRNLKLSADPRIITHSINDLNYELGSQQYFYSDIQKEGVLLFDDGKTELAVKRKLSVQERREVAQRHYDNWFESAVSFFDAYELMMSKEKYKNAAFQLHQSTESCYKAILLVLTNYNPREHFLKILAPECEQYVADLREIFIQDTEQQKERFKLLDSAYIDARYSLDYKISKSDLEILATDVNKLLQITKKVCEERIKNFS